MNLRTKIFLLLSLVLLCSIMLYVWIYSLMDQQRLNEGLAQRAKHTEYDFRAEQDSTEMRMLQIATFVANDSKVQQLFLLGKRAVELEGGGAGGELASQVRASLYEHVSQGQEILAKQFGFRQLHFHFGPGSLSFLRVHRPEKFGDRMDKVRYSIVASNAEQKNTMGFETGRIVSGIRGVTPVYAVDGATKEKVHVGALEAGTSFSNMLSLFQKNHPWVNAAVLLSQEHLEANIWPEFLEKLVRENQIINGFRVEGTTSSEIDHFLARDNFVEMVTSSGNHLLRDGNIHYLFSSFPLRDFRGETDPDIPDAGLVVTWQEVSKPLAAYQNNVSRLIFYGFLLFLTIEILMFFGLKLMTQGLQVELEQTRKHEIATKQARLVAEESSRLKTQFLNNMSHELRTPMNTIVGLGRLLSNSSLDHQQRGHIDKINLSSSHLLNLINEVLLVSEIDAEATEELPYKYYSPIRLANRLVEKFAVKAKDQRVNLKADIATGVPNGVDGYADQIEQILSQLLGNAIKFNPGGEVTLSLRVLERDGDGVILEYAVSDQGIGISTEQQQLIFQSFYQVDGSRTRENGGTGLGLTIARKICRQLGGDITVESTPGQGARFSFQLAYNVHAEDSDSPAAKVTNAVITVTENGKVAEQIMGTIPEIEKLLQQLEEPLAKMQPKPCQDIAAELKAKKWPERLSADIEELLRLVGEYRFVEAQDVVSRLKKLILK